MMENLSMFEWTSIILVVIGAINWGLLGIFGFDLVATILGEMTVLSRIAYTIIGLSGVYLALDLFTARSKESVSVQTGAAAS